MNSRAFLASILFVHLFWPLTLLADFSFKTEAFATLRKREFDKPIGAKSNLDEFFYFREEISYLSENWRATASPFLLVYNSQLVDIGTDGIVTSPFQPDRQLSLQTRLDHDRRTWTTLDLQEFFVGWSGDSLSLEFGRRILALGNFKLLPAWNKFNPTTTSLRPTWINGVDQLNGAYRSEKAKVIAYSIFDKDRLDQAQILEASYFATPFQYSLLAGQWWSANSVGFAMTIDSWGWLIKVETLSLNYFGSHQSLGKDFQSALGFERAFSEDWTINLEFLNQSSGESDRSKVISHQVTPHQSFRGRAYGAVEVRWTPNSFYVFSLLGLISLVDQSSMQGMTVSKQWGENAEISGGLFLPAGHGEFSKKAELDAASGGLNGAPAQYDLTIKYFY
ncbi:MAG: hypothetical protein IPK04_10365 [Bdellovibrionales bacterium]|nr:hypothetical protein [Bdellovibrionales bacterium]